MAVSHLDMTENALSTICCHYDDSYTRESLRTFAIQIGRERGASFLYLGYHVAENRHMSYKGCFHPCQVLAQEGHWLDYRDVKGKVLKNDNEIEFFLRTQLRGLPKGAMPDKLESSDGR